MVLKSTEPHRSSHRLKRARPQRTNSHQGPHGHDGRLASQGRHLRALQFGIPCAFTLLFFVAPVILLFRLAFNKPEQNVATFQPSLSFDSFSEFFHLAIYYNGLITSLRDAVLTTAIALILGFPIAYILAHTKHPWANTFVTILVLASMQLGIVVRTYGLTVLFGANGLINQAVHKFDPAYTLQLTNNEFGVVTGLVEFTLPFMVLSLVGVIQGIDPSLEQAARALGANRWVVIRRITLPLSMPGILSGSVLVFSISISSYVIPSMLGGGHVPSLPLQIYDLVFSTDIWELGAALSLILFFVCLVILVLYYVHAERSRKGFD